MFFNFNSVKYLKNVSDSTTTEVRERKNKYIFVIIRNFDFFSSVILPFYLNFKTINFYFINLATHF